MLLLVDNYDSFTYNLYHGLCAEGAEVEVVRHDARRVDDLLALRPAGIVISPGPGGPDAAGCSVELIRRCGDTPVLGVCLGHQCIAAAYGASIVRAPAPRHGKTSPIHHDGGPPFEGIASPCVATRYHSLAVDRATLPAALVVSAWTDDGVVMGLRHRARAVFGVQFHPESILTGAGPALLRRFVEIAEEGPHPRRAPEAEGLEMRP